MIAVLGSNGLYCWPRVTLEGLRLVGLGGSTPDCCTREIPGLESVVALPDRRRTGSRRAGGVATAVLGEPRSQPDANRGQWHAVHFVAVSGNACPASASRTAYHPPEGNSYIERFHRTLKEEGILQLARSARFHRPLDRGIQSRPTSSRGPKSHSAGQRQKK